MASSLADGLATAMPSSWKHCLESTEIISVPRAWASSIAKAVLPIAVGPQIINMVGASCNGSLKLIGYACFRLLKKHLHHDFLLRLHRYLLSYRYQHHLLPLQNHRWLLLGHISLQCRQTYHPTNSWYHIVVVQFLQP